MCVELFNLHDKVALVTGAGKGLGKSMALALSESGAHVAVVSRTFSDVEETAQEIEGNGVTSIPIAADVTKLADVKKMVDIVLAKFNTIDILVNNAGAFIGGKMQEFSLDDWYKTIEINLTSAYLCTKTVGMHMIEKKRGKIITISSALGVFGASRSSAYCSSKGGVIQLTKALAVEWAKYNINVNSIAPYTMETDTTREMLKDEKIKQSIISKIPLKRIGLPSDLSGTVVFLASKASDYITGQVIFVDGGFSAQ
ncbi:MAG: SDR family oxidoreductase [Candidatus Kuenenia sp.]|nr:SDR family oxidoreductase [Candidatus Kuenenia hertensis]